MGTITLSLPDKLKAEMDKTDFINWSSVARKAFAETLCDLKEIDARRKAFIISEIDGNDNRVIKDSVAKEVIDSVERTLRQGKRPMKPGELRAKLGLK
jgi:Arc/MetJ-type ribon-helix-helix transcriptional regulator